METDLKSSPGYLWVQMHVHGQKLGQDQGQTYRKPPTPMRQSRELVGWCGGEVEVVEGISEKGHFEPGASGLF